jgi:hypothetical protein
MKKQERHFHKSFYEILEKCTKAELITRLEDSDKQVRQERWKLDMPSEYQIIIYKNKKEVQSLEFTWDVCEHGARWDEVKDLEHSLMNAYQDYESIVESVIIIKNDWDERR